MSTAPELAPLAVSPDTAANLLGIGRTKLYELLDTGRITSIKVDRRRIIPMKALEAFLAGDAE
ncbi:MAG: helix-turn-helix domain-containing protein [Ilumatobacteraceae bacterium]